MLENIDGGCNCTSASPHRRREDILAPFDEDVELCVCGVKKWMTHRTPTDSSANFLTGNLQEATLHLNGSIKRWRTKTRNTSSRVFVSTSVIKFTCECLYVV